LADKITPFGREIASLSARPLKIEYKKTLTFIVRVVGERSEISNQLRHDIERIANSTLKI